MTDAKLYVGKTKGKGRGVFCEHPILKDDIIEQCPMLIMTANDYDSLGSTRLADYVFCFNKEENSRALALGFGSLYNHARLPNAHYAIDNETKIITFYALHSIDKHQEICINYGGKPGEDFIEWFAARDIAYCPSS